MKNIVTLVVLSFILLFNQACSKDDSTIVLETLSYATPNDNSVIVSGSKLQIDVLGHYSDGSSKNLNTSLIWSSSDETIATVTNGLITSHDSVEGNVTISYKTSDKLPDGEAIFTQDIIFEVINANLLSIEITPNQLSNFYEGLEKSLTATGNYDINTTSDITQDSNWTSSNEAVATVDENGTLKAIAEGDANVTATYKEKSATLLFTVLKSVYTTVSISANQSKFNVGETLQFRADGTNTNGDVVVVTDKVSWESNDTSVVSINAVSGLATANGIGRVNIKASIDSISSNFTVEVLTDQYLQLFTSSNTKLEFPYFCFPNTYCLKDISVSTSVTYIVIEEFKLIATGKDFTINNLKVTDFNDTNISTGIAKFTGLSEGQIITAGETVTFSVESVNSNSVQRELIYSFKIDNEFYPSFVASYLFETN